MPRQHVALTYREAARLLRVDRSKTLLALIRCGKLRSVPWGRWERIPLVDVQRLAETGFTDNDVKEQG